MPSDASSYLETEVLTASPQKLQLMLIEAAGRFTTLAERHWQADDDEQATEALIRAQNIVSELIGGLRLDEGSELVRRVAGVYVYVFRCLVQANLHRDAEKLGDARRVLEAERETWQQVCQQLDEQPEGATPAVPRTESVLPQAAAPPKFQSSPPATSTSSFPGSSGHDDLPAGGLNLEM